MNSITATKTQTRAFAIKWWAVILWILIWQVGSMMLKQEILLVSPVSIMLELIKLIRTADFWQNILYSWCRIMGGFLLASCLGFVLAIAAYHIQWLKDFLTPFILTVKAVPVASFIILILIWISSKNLAVVISFLMVMPIIYIHVLQGMEATDKQLLEMAQVFRLSVYKMIRYIYWPQVFPYFKAACVSGLGLSWKSGIAAEVIGIPEGSIGESLYQAKIYLDTPSLFAWTVTIVFISMVFEKLFLMFLEQVLKYSQRIGSSYGKHRH